MGLSCKSTCSTSDGPCWSLTEAECQTRLENASLHSGHPFPVPVDWLRDARKASSENVFLTVALVIVAWAQFQHWGYIDFGCIAWCNAIQFSKAHLDSNFRARAAAYMGYVLHRGWRAVSSRWRQMVLAPFWLSAVAHHQSGARPLHPSPKVHSPSDERVKGEGSVWQIENPPISLEGRIHYPPVHAHLQRNKIMGVKKQTTAARIKLFITTLHTCWCHGEWCCISFPMDFWLTLFGDYLFMKFNGTLWGGSREGCDFGNQSASWSKMNQGVAQKIATKKNV